MILPGLVSITFRQLSPEDIVARCAGCGLAGIEWGGDVHVPHGDLEAAKRVRTLSEEAGLQVAAYGSYYRAGEPGDLDFQAVLDSAAALGAPLIRVWAGKRSPADADEAYVAGVVEDLVRITEAARGQGIEIGLEYHRYTLTETRAMVQHLLRELPADGPRFLWQPSVGWSFEERCASLAELDGRLANLHVFEWQPDFQNRHPLADGHHQWPAYFRQALAQPGDRYALLEFVVDNNPEVLAADARALLDFLAEAATPSPRTP